MILTRLGLSAAMQKALLNTLAVSHKVKIRVGLLNLDGDHLGDISNYLVDGQVDLDDSEPVQRRATLVFDDPRRRLPFDTRSPADTALFFDRMVKVHYDVWVDDLGDYAEIPVFTGPITSLDRDGDQVSAHCEDKAVFGMAACWSPLHLHKHMKKTDAIRRIMTERCYETDLDIPDLTARLPRARTLHPQATPWTAARRIARGIDRQLYYDGDGVCRLRHHHTQARFTFSGQRHVVTPLQVSYSMDATHNAVKVLGAAPKGPKSQVQAQAVAGAHSVLSPDRLGRNGGPRYLAQFVNDDTLKTHAEAKARAKRVLADTLAQQVTVTFDSVPVPLLDPGDLCHVTTDDGSVNFRLHRFTLPLKLGEGDVGTPMTVGENRLHSRGPRHKGRRRRERRAA